MRSSAPTAPLHEALHPGIPANTDERWLGSRHIFKPFTHTRSSSDSPDRLVLLVSSFLSNWETGTEWLTNCLKYTLQSQVLHNGCVSRSPCQPKSLPTMSGVYFTQGGRALWGWQRSSLHTRLTHHRHEHTPGTWGREVYTFIGSWPAILKSPRKLFTFVIPSFYVFCFSCNVPHSEI